MRCRVCHKSTKTHATHKNTGKDRQEVADIHGHDRDHPVEDIRNISKSGTLEVGLTEDTQRQQEKRPPKLISLPH
jgi:hypothetical protein